MTDYIKINNKWALLVGIKDYYDDSINSLNYSNNDVNGLNKILTEKAAYKKKNIRLLTDENDHVLQTPIRSNILSNLQSICKTASDDDFILFYFSGHGFQENSNNYLCPADSRIGLLDQTAINLNVVKEIIKSSSARAKIIILDACHSEARIDKSGFGAMSDNFFKAIEDASEGTAILSSCKFNEVSYEWPEKKHSVFTYYIIEGLNGAADFDSDNIISIPDINRYITKKVMLWAFHNNKQQSPYLSYNVSGDIIFVQLKNGQKIRPTVPSTKTNYNYLSSISLISHESSYEPVIDEKIGKLTAYLSLNWFKISEFNKGPFNEISFPIGEIHKDATLGGSKFINFKLTYDDKKHDLFLDILDKISKFSAWKKISYEFNKSINLDKFEDIMIEYDMQIKSYFPDSKIELFAERWGRDGLPGHANFLIQRDTELIIKQESSGHSMSLEKNFINKSHPDLILPIINKLFI